MDDHDTSFLDIPGPSTRRWRRPPTTHSASAPPPITTQGGKLRKKSSRLFDGRARVAPSAEERGMQPVLNRSTASAPDVTPDTGSVDSRTSSGVVVVDPPQGSVALGTRVSNWWSSLLVPDSMGQGRRRSLRQGEQRGEGRSQRSLGGQSTTQTFLAAARQKAVGGVRYLLDGDALPEGTEEVWVRGVVHRFQDGGDTWPDSFLLDFRSTVWCTYRSQYAPIQPLPRIIVTADAYRRHQTQPVVEHVVENKPISPWTWMTNVAERTGLTTDSGWGCMLRTGQCLSANALIHHHLGREWRLPETPLNHGAPLEQTARDEYATYIQILQWFMDDPSPACPFSVHRMALAGNELGKGVGEWFGPSTAAGAVKTLTNGFPPCGLAIVTATDSTIYASEVVAASHQEPGDWADLMDTLPVRGKGEKRGAWGGSGVLILAGVRLGMQGVNPLYHDSIKALFTFPQSVGIAGGRPSSSYYFIGTQGDNLFYLDPHFTRPAIPLKTPGSADLPASVDWLLGAYTADQLKTFHCEKVKKMPISSLDPSMLMAFLVRDYEDWLDLRERLNNLSQRIISIENTVPTWGDDSDEPDIESFTETEVDEESTGLSRQLSASTLAFEGDIPRDEDSQEVLVPFVPTSANVGTSPPLTPTVSAHVESPGIPFPVHQGPPVEDSPDLSEVEDGFDSIKISVASPASPRHRSRSSGDQTVKGRLQP